MQLLALDQDVPRVKVAVQSNRPAATAAIERGVDGIEQMFCKTFVDFFELGRNELVVQQVIYGRFAKTFNVERRAVLEGFRLTVQVNSRHQAAELLKEVRIVELGGPARMAGADGQSKRAVAMQGFIADGNRRNHGDVAR